MKMVLVRVLCSRCVTSLAHHEVVLVFYSDGVLSTSLQITDWGDLKEKRTQVVRESACGVL